MAINKSILKDILSLVDLDELESETEGEDSGESEGETCPECGAQKGKGMEDLMSKKLTFPDAVDIKPESADKNEAKIDALVRLLTTVSDSKGA